MSGLLLDSNLGPVYRVRALRSSPRGALTGAGVSISTMAPHKAEGPQMAVSGRPRAARPRNRPWRQPAILRSSARPPRAYWGAGARQNTPMTETRADRSAG